MFISWGAERAHTQIWNVPERGHLQETESKATIQKREAGGGLPRETVINPSGPGEALVWPAGI